MTHIETNRIRSVLLVLVLVVMLLGVFAPAAKAVTPPSCPAVSVTRTGLQSNAVYQNNHSSTWDLRGAKWENSPNPVKYPIRSESWENGCVKGGRVAGNIPRSMTRDQWYNGSSSPYASGEAWRATFTNRTNAWASVRNTFISDVEDAFDPNHQNYSQKTYLTHVRTAFVRDDCIENEGSGVPGNMYLTNSLFDGCFTAFGMRPGSSGDQGTAPTEFVVDRSLVYVKPQPLGSKYCDSGRVAEGRCKVNGSSYLGSYGFWKWSADAPSKVVVRNSVFRLDMPSYSSCKGNQWPKGTYDNVTLVWTGAGSYAKAGGCDNVLPAGVTLTTDVGVWNRARTAWLNQ